VLPASICFNSGSAPSPSICPTGSAPLRSTLVAHCDFFAPYDSSGLLLQYMPTVGTLQIGYPTNKLQDKTKGKVCIHALPHATAALEPTSLLREDSSAATYPRLRTPPLRLGGLQCCHVARGSGPCLTIQEGSDAATRPSVPDPASPLQRALTLTRILRRTRLRDGLRC
jgi:hypothetical protein